MNWIPLGLDDVIAASTMIGLLVFGSVQLLAWVWFDLSKAVERKAKVRRLHKWITSRPGYEPPESFAGSEWVTLDDAEIERITGRKVER